MQKKLPAPILPTVWPFGGPFSICITRGSTVNSLSTLSVDQIRDGRKLEVAHVPLRCGKVLERVRERCGQLGWRRTVGCLTPSAKHLLVRAFLSFFGIALQVSNVKDPHIFDPMCVPHASRRSEAGTCGVPAFLARFLRRFCQ